MLLREDIDGQKYLQLILRGHFDACVFLNATLWVPGFSVYGVKNSISWASRHWQLITGVWFDWRAVNKERQREASTHHTEAQGVCWGYSRGSSIPGKPCSWAYYPAWGSTTAPCPLLSLGIAYFTSRLGALWNRKGWWSFLRLGEFAHFLISKAPSSKRECYSVEDLVTAQSCSRVLNWLSLD